MSGETSRTLLAEVEHVGEQLSANGAMESPSTGSLQERVSAGLCLVYEAVWNGRVDAVWSCFISRSLLTLLASSLTAAPLLPH